MFIGVETENVPVERVLRNLQVRLEADPSNAELHYQVARLHALASVRPPQSLLPVYKASRPERADAYIKSREGFPYYGGGDGSGVPDEVKRRPHDAAHLAKAIEHYETAMALMRANPSASSVRSILLRTQLGHAWCLARAGRRDEAIASYRLVLEVAWTKEILIPRGNSDLSWIAQWVKREKSPPGSPGVSINSDASVCFSEESIRSLLLLLHPEKDRVEIAELSSRLGKLGGMSRSITPILVPLVDAPLEELIAPGAQVAFDLDGSGLPRRWGWITPKAAWLVHDPRGSGKITSGLQLFGSVTFWIFWRDGYQALESLDDSGDGLLTGAELAGLGLWQDANGDGVSDPGEVRTLAEHGIVGLSCRGELVRPDLIRSDRGARLSDGSTRPTFDWHVPMTGPSRRE